MYFIFLIFYWQTLFLCDDVVYMYVCVSLYVSDHASNSMLLLCVSAGQLLMVSQVPL